MSDTPKSIYDKEPAEDPWFLPEKPLDQAPTDLPWNVAERRGLINPNDWQYAEDKQGRALAKAAAAFARLDERMRGQNINRLAMLEVAEVLWAGGDRIETATIALYIHQRESTLENAQILSATDWAVRRLHGSLMPTAELAGFLGRHATEHDGLADIGTRLVGDEFDGIAADWHALLDQLSQTHPFTRAACAFHAWRVFGLSETGTMLEPAIVASKLCSVEGRNLAFVPLVLGDRHILSQGGSVGERLAAWYKAIETACLRGLMLMDQLTDWITKAEAQTRDLSGKTAPILIDALRDIPVLSAGMAAEITGMSKAAIQRNLAEFHARGLIREVTGQGRYRFWTARF